MNLLVKFFTSFCVIQALDTCSNGNCDVVVGKCGMNTGKIRYYNFFAGKRVKVNT